MVAQRERVVESALVRDEHRDRHVVGNLGAAQDLGAVGQLRDHVGAHEARDLQPPEASLREQLHEPHLVVSRDDLGLVLEAVPRADLANPHVFGHVQILARPPLTPSDWPVTYDASSEARNAIAAATSSG